MEKLELRIEGMHFGSRAAYQQLALSKSSVPNNFRHGENAYLFPDPLLSAMHSFNF